MMLYERLRPYEPALREAADYLDAKHPGVKISFAGAENYGSLMTVTVLSDDGDPAAALTDARAAWLAVTRAEPSINPGSGKQQWTLGAPSRLNVHG